MKYFHKKKTTILVCMIAIIVIFAMCNVLLLQKAYAAESDEKISNITENLYDITNTNKPNGLDIELYAENNYAKNASVEITDPKTNRREVFITGNDDIIKIIPEELFKSVGVAQHIGKEYGFFIETREKIIDSGVSYDHAVLLSTVMIIDVTNTDNMYATDSKSHLKIEIKPIFQADFAYVKSGLNYKIPYLREQN